MEFSRASQRPQMPSATAGNSAVDLSAPALPTLGNLKPKLTLIVVLALLVSACGASSTAAPAGSAPAGSASSGTPQAGGTITVAQLEDADVLDPSHPACAHLDGEWRWHENGGDRGARGFGGVGDGVEDRDLVAGVLEKLQ